jgi:ribulose-phosphate 3-epimerase
MVDRPAQLLPVFHAAGADRLILHQEACPHLHRDVATIRNLGLLPGVALNPATPVASLESIIDEIDEVLLMGVDPGFGGQAFIESVADKIAITRIAIDARGSRAKINVDGGVKVENAQGLASRGADYLVVGSALFGSPSIAGCAHRFRALFSPMEVAV